jgi:hypothetical protein
VPKKCPRNLEWHVSQSCFASKPPAFFDVIVVECASTLADGSCFRWPEPKLSLDARTHIGRRVVLLAARAETEATPRTTGVRTTCSCNRWTRIQSLCYVFVNILKLSRQAIAMLVADDRHLVVTWGKCQFKHSSS